MTDQAPLTIAGFSEPLFRFLAFAAVFVAMAALEWLRPKRRLTLARLRRWPTNLAIVGIDSLVVRAMAALPQLLGAVAVPLAAVAAAMLAESHGIGLLNVIALPVWLEILIALVVLDFAIWLQHLASHKVGMFWQLHQVHHADRDFDVTTAIRFHPVEIALSMLYKIVWVFVLGPSALAVLTFEVILNGCAMFNHANVDLPRPLDRVLRLVLVTPDMHRVHHSVLRREHDSNYGFNLSVWDRLFGTYTPEPERGHADMTIGLAPYQDEAPARLGWSLTVPFRGRPGSGGRPG
jgi:sterol desaturase/sphingolipid hydroxylase (fatty acid hydroxylase superfamily)